MRHVSEINILLGKPDRETDSLYNLTLKKLAHFPTFATFTDIGKRKIENAEVYFSDSEKAFDIDTVRIPCFLSLCHCSSLSWIRLD